MKRKFVITAMLALALFCLASCGEKEQEQGMREEDIQSSEAGAQPDEKEKEEENNTVEHDNMKEQIPDKEDKKVLIYYGNDNADGLIYKEAALSELSAEALVGELAKVNIVSLDTKVRTVFIDEKDAKLLHLDMSKEFGEYVSMMGTAGEYIVIGGLADTFLDAYDCERVKITVEGKTLETGHTAYEGELQFFEVQNTKRVENGK
ncbi:MAG: GerMN domain-containing protein [Lachnospiraceae bacterium]|nr:GerMN domain-containing protein [Lachnospiraceae bacterium]